MIEFRLVFKDKILPETMGSYPQIDWVFHGFPSKCVILSHHFLSREVSKRSANPNLAALSNNVECEFGMVT